MIIDYNGLSVQIPKGKTKSPAVILVQGFGMTRHEYKNSHDEIAGSLVRAGIASVQFEFSYISKMSEKYDHEISLDKRALEVNSVIVQTIQLQGLDPDRIGILGMSFGVSTILKSDYSRMKSLCFVSGLGFRPKKFMDRYINKGAVINRAGETELPRSSGKTTIISRDFWTSFETLEQEKLVRLLNKPVLVIHGNLDSYIAKDDMYAVYSSMKSAHKELKVFENGDHGIIDVARPMREEFLNTVTDWFRHTL